MLIKFFKGTVEVNIPLWLFLIREFTKLYASFYQQEEIKVPFKNH